MVEAKAVEESYEQKRAREIAENKKFNAEYAKRFSNIIKLLGFKVEPQKEEEGEWVSKGVSVSAVKGGEGFSLRAGGYANENRIKVSPDYPRDSRGQCKQPNFPNEPSWYGIGLSPEKSDEQIAKDIERRFFPEYRKRLANVIEQCKASDKYFSKKQSNAKFVLGRELSEKEVEQDKCEFYFRNNSEDYRPSADVRVNSGDVDLKIGGVSPEQAVAVLKLLKLKERK